VDISVKLPRFEGEKALIVVTGSEAARFYVGQEGRVKELTFFRVHPPNYPDREGYRGEGGKNRGLGFGDMSDGKDTWTTQEFLTHFRDTLKVILDHEKPSGIYLFAPSETLDALKQKMSFMTRRKIKMEIRGNYINQHPFRVLQKITEEKEREENQRIPINPESKKILEKESHQRKRQY
jgi:hypothetical protein